MSEVNSPIRLAMVQGVNSQLNDTDDEKIDGIKILEDRTILKPPPKRIPFWFRCLKCYDKCQLFTMTVIYYIQIAVIVLVYFALKADIEILKTSVPSKGLAGNILTLNNTLQITNNEVLPYSVLNSSEITAVYCSQYHKYIYIEPANRFLESPASLLKPESAIGTYYRTTVGDANIEYHEWGNPIHTDKKWVRIGCFVNPNIYLTLFNAVIGSLVLFVSTLAMKSKAESVFLAIKIFVYDGLILGRRKKQAKCSYEQCVVCSKRLTVSSYNTTMLGDRVCNQHLKHSTLIKGSVMIFFYVFYMVYIIIDLVVISGNFLTIQLKFYYALSMVAYNTGGFAYIPIAVGEHYIIKVTLYYCKKNKFVNIDSDDEDDASSIEMKEENSQKNNKKQLKL